MTSLDRWVRARNEVAEYTARVKGENDSSAAFNEAKSEAAAAMSEIDAMSGTAEADLDITQLLAKKRRCDAELKALSKQKADPNVDLDDAAFHAAAAEVLAEKELLEKDIEVKMKMDRSSLDRGANALAKFNKEVEHGSGHLSSWVKSLGKVRLQLGFVSGTVRQAGIAFTLLGPLMLHLVGGASALVGVLGTGLTGAFAVAGAAATGFGLSALGAGLALRQPIHQLGVAWKASVAYSDAVQKYGRDSTQAADKQDQFNSSMKGLPPEAQKAMRSLGDVKDSFTELAAGPIRADFFKTFAAGVKTAKALMPTFANESRKTFAAASDGVNKWFAALRSPEGKQAIADIMGNFRKSVPALMDAFGQLGAMLGHVFQSASKSLPELMNGFKQWATNLNQAVGSGASLDSNMDRLVSHMQTLGHFTQATGRLMVTFFNSGANSGQGMLQTLTQAENRWTSWMKSAEGKNSLQDFFSRSAAGTSQFMSTLARMGHLLVNFATITQPFGDAMLTATSAVASLVTILTELPVTGTALKGLGEVLVGLFAVNKVRQFVQYIKEAYAAFKGTAAVQAFMTGLTGANTAATGANTAATGANAASKLEQAAATEAAIAAETGQTAALAANSAATGANAAASGGLLSRLGAFAGALGPLATAGVVIGTIVGGGLLLNHFFGQASTKAEEFSGHMKDLNTAMNTVKVSQNEMTAAQQHSVSLWNKVNKLTKEGHDNTKAYTQSVQEWAHAQQQQATAQQHNQRATRDAASNLRKLNTDTTDAKQRLVDYIQSGHRSGPMFDALKNTYTSFAASLRLATLNYNRLKAGAEAATPAMLKSLSQIKSIAGRQTALRFRFSDQDVTSGIARVSGRLRGLGRKQQVINILANSKNAEQALVALQRLLNRVTGGKKNVHIGAEDEASGKVEKIKGKIAQIRAKIVKLSAQDQAGAKVDALKAKIAQLQNKSVTLTTNVVTNYIDHHHTTGKYTGGVQQYALGGLNDYQQRRAHDMAIRKPGKSAQPGMKVQAPQYIVGEEPGRTEYIITDNPQYRTSNMRFLRMAAGALGQQIIPGYKKGKGKGKPGAAPKAADASPNPLLTQWTNAVNDQAFWSDEYELDKRSYDSHVGGGGTVGGFDLNSLLADIGFSPGLAETGGGQIGAYRRMLALYGPIGKLSKQPNIKDLKNPKTKKAKKKQRNIDRQNAAIDDRNAKIDEANSDLGSFSPGQLAHLIQGLTLDAQELIYGEANAQAQSTETTNSLRQSLYNQFAGNVMGGGYVGPSLGSTGLSTQTSFPALGGASPATMGGGPSLASAQFTGGTGGNAITINNTFPTPPPDPHTFVQGVSFEIQAASP